ncbi:MAG: hypothetical protein ACRD4D_06150 [Candidatus Acidiferrales bacterium]
MSTGSSPQPPPLELTPAQLESLRRFTTEGFEIVRFQYFESQVGLRKYGCAALLAPQPDGTFRLAAAPTVIIEGHLSARVERGGEEWFVWKTHRVRATPELQDALQRIESELRSLLEPPPAC